MSQQKIINKQRERRSYRVRNGVRGTAERPRLSVYRSNRHIAAQVIDDEQGKTLAAVSTQQKDVAEGLESTCNVEAAIKIGQILAERAKAAGVDKVAFDRGYYRYHGKVAALAKAAREAGLNF
ncbi:50S ribosomal protein L18 [bacterium]|jgi:large subunit ribosomal protein L18|nr:50S ribosomal protein L18 [bacterium]